jgi:hypothetical protein
MEDLLRELIAEVKGLREDLALQAFARFVLTPEQKQDVLFPPYPISLPFHKHLTRWITEVYQAATRAYWKSVKAQSRLPAESPPANPPPPVEH